MKSNNISPKPTQPKKPQDQLLDSLIQYSFLYNSRMKILFYFCPFGL